MAAALGLTSCNPATESESCNKIPEGAAPQSVDIGGKYIPASVQNGEAVFLTSLKEVSPHAGDGQTVVINGVTLKVKKAKDGSFWACTGGPEGTPTQLP